MDKNNDIQVNKVDKWCEGVADASLRQAKKSVDMFLCCYSPMLSIEALDAVRTIYVYLDEALDRFNELEARHQKDTGMITEYEEENKNFKSELDIKTDECDDLISRVLQQDEEYTKLEAENHDKDDALKKMIKEVAELEKEKIDLEVRLDQSDELRYRNAKYAWAIKTILKKATFSPSHVGNELRFMARKSTTPKDVQERWEEYADELLEEYSKLVDKIRRLEKKIDKLEKALNDKKVTTWEEVERELFTPEEIVESHLRVECMADKIRCLNRIERMANKIERLEKENDELSSQVSGLKEDCDRLKDRPICGEIKWVLREEDC